MFIKVFTAFSGYDSQCLGLERLKEYDSDFDYELVGWSEIDKNAIKAHNALFPQYSEKNYGDISKVNWNEVEDFDLFTYSSPCQDFSAAGMQRGGTEGSGTRSSLLWECRRCIETKRPKYLLLENVTGLLQSKFYELFQKWIKTVNSFGYVSTFAVLNSRNFGVPQNRERVFLVSIRKDVNINYSFPVYDGTCPHLRDILEDNDKISKKWTRSDKRRLHYIELNKDALIKLENNKNYRTDGYEVIPCGVYCHSSDPFNSPPLLDCSRTLKSESIESGILYKKDGEWRERLFTPRELFRLMGLRDEEYDKLEEAVPESPRMKCAGNSIVVNVLFHIFRRMFTDTDIPDKGQQYTLF